jgi:hypothetical protein
VHLIIYTQKRESPYIIRVYLILLLLAVLVLASLVSLIIYSGLKATAIQGEIHILRLRKIEAELGLARIDAEFSSFKERLGNLQQDKNMPAIIGEALTLHPDSSRYAVQVSAHRNFQDAERIVQSIHGRISRRVAVQPARLATGLWFRVLVTPFDTQAEAKSYADSLVRQKIIQEYYIQRIPRASASSDTSAATGSRN